MRCLVVALLNVAARWLPLACLVVALLNVVAACAIVPNKADVVRQAHAAMDTPPVVHASPAAAVAGDAVLLARLGGAVAVVGLALAVGFRSRALLYVSAAGAVAVVGAVAMGQVVPWLPWASLIGAVGGVVAALAWLVLHHKGKAATASALLERGQAWISETAEAAGLVGQVVPAPAPAPGSPANLG